MHKAPKKVPHLLQNWQWGLEIDGFLSALFVKGKPPKITNQEAVFHSGGSLYGKPMAGKVEFEPITFSKGIIADGSDDSALDWLFKTFNVNLEAGWVPADYMKTIDVIEFARTGQPFRRWRLFESWIKSLDYDEHDGESSDITMEMLEIRYHKAYPVHPDGLKSGPIYNEKPDEIPIIAGREQSVFSGIIGFNP